MSDSFLKYTESNPFSTRFTAPGKTPFFFDQSFLRRMRSAHPLKFEDFFARALGHGEDIRTSVCVQFLADEFVSKSCRGQIVGAHGTGKTSLMHVLKEALTNDGYEIFSWSLHDQQSFLPDVFWFELQHFLQKAPSFLPPKCLLPPPVVSQQDYLEQQRESLRAVFSEESSVFDVESDYDESGGRELGADELGVEAVEEFTVVGTSRESNASDALSDSASSSASGAVDLSYDVERTRHASSGFFGFNEAGNFGLNATRSDSSVESEVKFAPFPGVAPPNETIDSSETDSSNASDANEKKEGEKYEEKYDDVRLVSESDSGVLVQKKLEIPLPVGYDFQKNRSFFERKVVFFDGFEQLSYVNRIILRSFCRMNRLGLLLSTHSPAVGVPVLFRTNPSLDVLRQLMEFLLEDVDTKIEDSELEELLKNFHYNIREILFSLYDAFEKYRLAPRELREREQIVRRYPR